LSTTELATKPVHLASQMVGELRCRVHLYITNVALWSFSVCSLFNVCWKQIHHTVKQLFMCLNNYVFFITTVQSLNFITNSLVPFNGHLSGLSGFTDAFYRLNVFSCGTCLTVVKH